MKFLMTIVAAVAFTSAVSAQQSVCSVTTENGTSLVSFNASVRTVSTTGGVNVVDRKTGEVLDFIPITSSRFGIRCIPTRTSSRNSNEGSFNSSITRNSTSGSTRSSVVSTSSSSSGSSGTTSRSTSPSRRSSSTGGGFPASAALGLP